MKNEIITIFDCDTNKKKQLFIGEFVYLLSNYNSEYLGQIVKFNNCSVWVELHNKVEVLRTNKLLYFKSKIQYLRR